MLERALGLMPSGSAMTDRLIKIWSEVLEVPVGLHETFLDLGGDSLAAMGCIVRLRDAFGVELTVDDFLTEESTVAGFAAKLEQMH
jgi:phthiocerol/phenolphthiocerol synthesis type-I polyketide synthase E